MQNNFKYSLWKLDHASIYTCYVDKIKDTNSSSEVDKWMNKGGAASFYREEDNLNADYVQLFQEQ